MALRLRVRTPDNAVLQITELSGTSTLAELQQLLATKSKIPAYQQERMCNQCGTNIRSFIWIPAKATGYFEP